VGVENAFLDGIWILERIRISMMGTVVTGPPPDRTLDSSSAYGSEEYLNGKDGGI
jgi:hypothetical protein